MQTIKKISYRSTLIDAKIMRLEQSSNKKKRREDLKNNEEKEQVKNQKNPLIERETRSRKNSLNPQTDSSDLILVVDDTPSNLQVLFPCLEKAGFKVLVAQDGESAINIAESKRPDLILLDILMPGLDGFETCRLLKAKVSTREIPIIFLTALSETANKVKGFELGGVDYVTKPIQQEEVLARIRTHLSLRKMSQRLAAKNEELQQEIDTRKQVELQLQKRTSQLQQSLNSEALIRRITEKIRDSLDESQILQTATKELAQILQVDRAKIELYDTSHTLATIAYEYSTTSSKCQGMTRKLAEFRELYQQLLQKKPLQFANLTAELNPKYSICSRLACPIFDDRGILGNLWLVRPREELFAEFEVCLVQQVASQCAIAIRQARLYEAAQMQVKELENLNVLKDDFLKTISHELRAPMSSIQLAAQTLEKFLSAESSVKKSPTFAKVFKIFQQACQRQKQLVDDLLTLCYIEAKAEKVIKESIDLQAWIFEIVQPFLENARDRQQHLNIDLDEQIPEFECDPFTLQRILTELLNNACKYTPAGETITVKASATEEIVRVSVSNSGVEIPPEERERIFDQFYRIPNNDPWQYGGTGLGLTLVKKLAELLQGSIYLESEEGLTTFCLELPT